MVEDDVVVTNEVVVDGASVVDSSGTSAELVFEDPPQLVANVVSATTPTTTMQARVAPDTNNDLDLTWIPCL